MAPPGKTVPAGKLNHEPERRQDRRKDDLRVARDLQDSLLQPDRNVVLGVSAVSSNLLLRVTDSRSLQRKYTQYVPRLVQDQLKNTHISSISDLIPRYPRRLQARPSSQRLNLQRKWKNIDRPDTPTLSARHHKASAGLDSRSLRSRVCSY